MMLADILDAEALEAAIADGLVNRRQYGDLVTLNYSDRCAYSRAWTPTTVACRGIVATADGRLVARPFGKFFNLDEPDAPAPPVGSYEVTEKVDGSLAVIFEWDGAARVATRGSLESAQAKWATEWWHCTHGADVVPPQGVTWLGEILYPENRIVVDYGDREDVVGLAAINNATGGDVPLDDWPGSVARRYECPDLRQVRDLVADDGRSEGFVVAWHRPAEPSVRLKVKMAEYVRLHRIVTGLSERAIWEGLAVGRSVDAIADGVPDEMHAWLREVVGGLCDQFRRVELSARSVLPGVEGLSRRDAAELIVPSPFPGVTWKMYDGKPYAELDLAPHPTVRGANLPRRRCRLGDGVERRDSPVAGRTRRPAAARRHHRLPRLDGPQGHPRRLGCGRGDGPPVGCDRRRRAGRRSDRRAGVGVEGAPPRGWLGERPRGLGEARESGGADPEPADALAYACQAAEIGVTPVVLAYPQSGSRGTLDMIAACEAAGVRVLRRA